MIPVEEALTRITGALRTMPAEQVPGYCRRVQAAGGDIRVLVEQGRAAG